MKLFEKLINLVVRKGTMVLKKDRKISWILHVKMKKLCKS